MLNIPTQRLNNQQIEQPQFQNPVEIVSWLGAIQGQDYPGAKWSIGLRLPGSTDAQIEQAIAENKIVRTWVMRGTLHLMASEDLRWMVELTASRTLTQRKFRYKQLEIDEATLQQSNIILMNALEGRKKLTRRELFAILEQNGISTQGQRGIHLLQAASLDCLIFQGVTQNNNPFFMRMDEWLPHIKTLAHDEALSELAKRYFMSRGPATLQDFANWANLTLGDTRAGFEAIKSELIEDKFEGKSYWRSSSSMVKSAHSPTVYMLPGFDEYLLGYKDRDIVLDPEHATKVCPGRNGIFFPTIVVDGRIVGIWKRAVKKDRVNITTELFDKPLNPEEQAAFEQAAQRFGGYLGMPASLEI